MIDPLAISQTPDRVNQLLSEERRRRRVMTGRIAAVLVLIFISLWVTEMLNGARLAEGLPAIGTIMSEMWPLDFSRWKQWIGPLIDTIAMSIAGTALAVAMSVPMAILAARNTSPHPAVYQAARLILNTLRAIPELIMGIVFVAAVGFGMLPGVLALGLHSVGMVGKFFAEAIEHAHPAPVEAAQATGATRMQVITHGVFPQVIPYYADVTMYRWEYNFRQSTVMGMVGAGGIGTELIGSLRILDYPQVGAILLVILGAVTVVDTLSNYLRRTFQ